jgi:phosphonate metabolism-associated iron-containing alcohol dehydrogenase
MARWYMPVEVRFGAGALRELPDLVGPGRALVLLYPQGGAAGWPARIERLLGAGRVECLVAPDGLPTLAQARRLSVDVWSRVEASPVATVIAIGGGATMDLAKAACHRPRSRVFDDLAAWIRGEGSMPSLDRIPLVAVPTTAGTGGEVTPWATLWDMDAGAGRKLSLHSAGGYPRAAIVDPDSTRSCPPAVTRDSGLDALAHALEAIWNRNATAVTDGLAIDAARQVLAALPAVLAEPDRLDLRERMSLAALQAGLAFAQTQTALAHALSYEVTLTRGTPHGLACAIWLPTACRLALGHERRCDAALAAVFGCGAAPADALEAWLVALGVDLALDRYGVADPAARIAAALGSARGRNFIAAPDRAAA